MNAVLLLLIIHGWSVFGLSFAEKPTGYETTFES